MTSPDVFVLTTPFSSTGLVKVVPQKDAGEGNVLVNQNLGIVLLHWWLLVSASQDPLTQDQYGISMSPFEPLSPVSDLISADISPWSTSEVNLAHCVCYDTCPLQFWHLHIPTNITKTSVWVLIFYGFAGIQVTTKIFSVPCAFWDLQLKTMCKVLVRIVWCAFYQQSDLLNKFRFNRKHELFGTQLNSVE